MISTLSKFLFGRVFAVSVLIFAVIGNVSNAQGISGELVIMNWVTGSEGDTFRAIEKAFSEKYPEVKIREIALSGSGDPRSAIRTALLGGEAADVLINTWPAFRAELVQAGMLNSIDELWDSRKFSERLNDNWRALGQTGGKTYGVPYTYGDRSGLWYRQDTLAKAGIAAAPRTLEEWKATFKPLREAGVTPFAVPGKVWAHAEIFETLLVRTAGVEFATDLAARKVAWTDDRVKNTLRIWRDLLEASCCADVPTMLATDWDNSADAVVRNGTAGYVLLGTWINGRATKVYGLVGGKDFNFLQFPNLGLGHDDTTIVDAKEVLQLASGTNKPAADAFLDFISGPEAANILAKSGLLSPSSAVNAADYGPVLQAAAAAVSQAKKVQFVIGDLLPGDLVDEYRVQLQKFLQDPSDANINAVTAAIEAKAADVY